MAYISPYWLFRALIISRPVNSTLDEKAKHPARSGVAWQQSGRRPNLRQAHVGRSSLNPL